MQLIPRFRGWISTYYPGTLLSISEYSIDSGQKSIVDAIAEMDVLGIFGREPLDFANMWSAPGPQDPIAYAFRIFRNYDGNGSQFGDTSVSAVSSDQGSLSIYGAQRSSDNAVTILVINKTTGALASAIAIANVSLPPTAQVYTYSGASLTSIAHPADAAITGGSVSYSFPAYSATLFVVQPSSTTAATTTTALSASAAQINPGQSVTFTVAVTASAGSSPTGTVTLLDGSTSLGTASLTNGSATFTIATLAAGTHSITASYAGDSADNASTSGAVSVVVNAVQLQASAVTLAASASTVVSGQTITLTATVTPASATGTVTFNDGSTSIGTGTLSQGQAVLTLSTLSVGTHSLTAAYGGDAADQASTSTAVTVTITAAITAPPPAADYGLTLSAGTLTVTHGASGSLTISVAPENGFSASLSFACSGLPSGWGCSFAPSTLSGNKSQSTTMTVSQTSSSRLMPGPSGLVLALVSPLSLFLFGLSGKSRRARWMLLGVFLLALAGCSTSNSSQPAPSTYNVTVTASGTSAPTHSQTFVLTMTQ
jgi:hypothetical protein